MQALYVQYQPIILVEDESCFAFEALVRMDTSPIGFISPAEFIPLAEQSKLIIPIGNTVLRTACVRARELLDMGHKFDHMSVNISAVQLAEPDFVENVTKIVGETGLDPHRLQLEVTESEMITNLEDSIVKLRQLQNCGITIALDDFGTGYSSMKYLREIPLNSIKIDKHFVDEIEQDVQNLLVLVMLQMSHDLGHTVIAEGVETMKQYEFLKEAGCDYIQGYYFSRPLYSDDAEDFLAEREKRLSAQPPLELMG
jgi:EAL domain-containing protein (putative c-di-GMP-specific phosphodiesterase class I)